MKFFDPERASSAPVHFTLYLDRELFESSQQAARLLGHGSVERMIESLLRSTVTELEGQGQDLRPFWEKSGEVTAR